MFLKAAMRHSGSLRLRLSCRKVRIGAAAKGLAALPLGANLAA